MLLPRAEFWRIWGVAALLFAALFLGTTRAKADESFWLFRPHAAPTQAVHSVHRFAHRHVVTPIVAGGERALRRAGGVIAEAAHWLGHGNMTGTRGPWCADFASMVLRRTGHHTVHSRLARDAVHAGRPIARPVPGAIMSMPHHTGFVVRVVGPGRVLLISGNHSHRVGIGIYPTRGARFALPA